MTTYNGEKYIEQQLDSIFKQTYTNWELIISDDSSTDRTLEIVKKFQENDSDGKVRVLKGPEKGFNFNFMYLVCNNDIKADLYAFADQDDIWDAKKLEVSILYFRKIDRNIPFLYCSRTKYIDEKNNFYNHSPLFLKPVTFENAIVQSIAGGNTMLFNNYTRDLLQKIGKEYEVVSHDWAAYQVVSGSNGHVYYDNWPSVNYRQHPNNLVGNNISFISRIKRIKYLLDGTFKEWNSINLRYLLKIKDYLSEDSKEIIDELLEIRGLSFLKRMYRLKTLKFYRQTFAGNLALKIAIIINKI